MVVFVERVVFRGDTENKKRGSQVKSEITPIESMLVIKTNEQL